MKYPRGLDYIQPGPVPFGDITLKITPTAGIAANKPPEASAPFYVLQSLADMPMLLNLQENMAEAGSKSMRLDGVIRSLDEFIQGVKSRSALRPKTKGGKDAGGDWLECARITRDWLAAGPDRTPCPSPIFGEGNQKLPYWAFSALPGVTCPGAGECLRQAGGKRGWCYSFRAWRYPASFFRQFNMTVLLRLPDKTPIHRALEQCIAMDRKQGKQATTVRLYVDGDIDSIETLDFWMKTLRKYPMVRGYGYSKSWHLFLEYDKKIAGDWPSNYVLNLSGGSKYDRMPAMIEAMMRLPITRERFVALKIPKMRNASGKMAKIPQNVIDTGRLTEAQRNIFETTNKIPAGISEFAFRRNPVYTKTVLEEAAKRYPGKRVFVCPGKCGNCLGGGKHACGDKRANIPIVIGVH